jgi:signal transduction histidine kinase
MLGALTLRKPAGESLTAAEDRLLTDVAAQTALVIVQQQQGEQLQAAARRIVTAEDAARRRIERDLHDGAQQRLVTLGLELGVLAERATADPALAASVRAVREQLLDATSELRELARGLHPMVLTEQGLATALEALADRSPVPVKLSVVLDDRLPREIEATTYFLVSEALTNATRHSDARLVRVCVSKGDGGLHVAVTDDGRGGAARRDGGGLQGMADRLAALGAQLHLDSPPGNGTRITTVLPCA